MSHKKQIFKLNNLKKLLTDENSCVSLVPTTRLLALPPLFLDDMKSGILYMLNNMLKKYDRSLGGIVIGYQNIKVLMDENTGIIPIGTSETEVNVSVEFYIFQPKIGSHLEGVINKKSNNHIGCLVHQYFNATILKPDSVDYENWICKDFKVDDKVIFKVVDLDFTSLLPYIEGVIDDKNLLNKVKSNVHKNCDTNSLIVNNVKSHHQNEFSLPKEFLKNKKEKSKNEQVCILEGNLKKNFEKIVPFSYLGEKKKKKDKDKKKLSVHHNKSEKEKSSSDEELTLNTTMLNSDKSFADEKKKRKKKIQSVVEKKFQENCDSQDNNSSDLNNSIFTKSFQMENQSIGDFTETHKRKKEKKKKKDKKEKSMHFNETHQGLPSKELENSVLYSTLLDHIQTKKMRISFCSPITQSTPAAEKNKVKSSTQDLSSSIQTKNQNEVEKEKKKKQKKRQREEEKESLAFPSSKKVKTLQGSTFRDEDPKDDQEKSEVQSITEELYRQQLKRVKEILSVSDKDTCLEEKKKKGKIKKQDKELSDVDKNEKTLINGESDVKEKSETQNLFDKLCKQELQRVKEQLSMTGRDCSVTKKTKVKMNKPGKNISKEKIDDYSKETQITKAQINGTNKGEEKYAMQDLVDQLLKQEINRVKQDFEDSGTDTIKERKEMKNDQETLKEGTHDSLYEKLLNEAKSSIDLGRGKVPTLLPTVGKNKKDSDLSDVSIGFPTKKNLKRKKKTEICLNAHDKYRNGSMYDWATTPEKVHPDKSLFSDSEHSHMSPFKRVKETHGTEAKPRKSVVQNMLDEFFEEERKAFQSESDRDNLKKREKKRGKSEQKSHGTSRKEESLYEKLLKEAKSLVDIEDQSVPLKKKKKLS